MQRSLPVMLYKLSLKVCIPKEKRRAGGESQSEIKTFTHIQKSQFVTNHTEPSDNQSSQLGESIGENLSTVFLRP